jgi:hypothetical protein
MKILFYTLVASAVLLIGCNDSDSTSEFTEEQKNEISNLVNSQNPGTKQAKDLYSDVMANVTPVLAQMDSLTNLLRGGSTSDIVARTGTGLSVIVAKSAYLKTLSVSSDVNHGDSLIAKAIDLNNSVSNICMYLSVNQHLLKTKSLDPDKLSSLLNAHFDAHDELVKYQHTFAEANKFKITAK